MSTNAISGLTGLLYVEGNEVAEVTDVVLTIQHTPQDTSNDDSHGWNEYVTGIRLATFKVSGNLTVSDANGFQKIQTGILTFNAPTLYCKLFSELFGMHWEGACCVTRGQLGLVNLKNPQKVDWDLKFTGPITVSQDNTMEPVDIDDNEVTISEF